MILSNIKGITIPEGAVKQIADNTGRILWKGGASVDVAALVIGYNGDYTDQTDVVMSGKHYRLLTLTGSGTLTLDTEVKADIWLCNGGNSGQGRGSGGGGGYIFQSTGQVLGATTVCVIGAGGEGGSTSTSGYAGGSTTFGDATAEAQTNGSDYIANGASGGGYGGGYDSRKGVGAYVPTTPFGETTIFDLHSAGGGGGGLRDREDNRTYNGGAGGSDGSDGSDRTSSGNSYGTGGVKGGGVGGTGDAATTRNGNDATFYGSGGGGGGEYYDTAGKRTNGRGGAGYQGIVYVRIPYEQ